MIPSLLFAERVIIRKALDSNLFETKDGRKIRLAYVDAPSVADPNPKIRALARRIKRFAKEELVGQAVEIAYVDSAGIAGGVRRVRLWKKFLLQTVDYIQRYLENGFGKLIPDSGEAMDPKYLAAGQRAQNRQLGVWSKYLYEPAPPIIYSFGLVMGGGDNQELNLPYKEARFTAGPVGTGNGPSIRFNIIYSDVSQLYSKPEYGISSYLINPSWTRNGQFFGIDIGMLVLKLPPDLRRRTFVFPNGALRLGFLNRAYISFDFLTDLIYAPYSVGLNFLSDQPHFRFWVGVTLPRRNRHVTAVKTEFGITNHLFLKAQAVHFRYRFAPKSQFGMRIGIGYKFNVGGG